MPMTQFFQSVPRSYPAWLHRGLPGVVFTGEKNFLRCITRAVKHVAIIG